MARQQTKAEIIANTPIEELMRLGGEQGAAKLREYLRALRYGYNRRVQSFRRQGIISHAEIAFNRSRATETKYKPVSKLNHNQLILEIARYQKFFTDKTSSIVGIREVETEQDKRIFGEDSRGRPLMRMSQQERADFWELYDEFMHQNRRFDNEVQSGQVQFMLRDAIYQDEGFKDMSFAEKLNYIRMAMDNDGEIPDIEDVANVRSGRGYSDN